MVGAGLTVTVREAVIWFPQASVTMEYSVTVPAVGKVMLADGPDPTEGVPVGLKLQL